MENKDVEELRKNLKLASELTKDIDSDLRLEAFRYALSELTSRVTGARPDSSQERTSEKFKENGQDVPQDEPDFFEKIAEETMIDIKSLKSLISFDQEDSKFTLKFSPKNERQTEKQIDATSIYLTVKKIGLGIDNANSRELREVVRRLGVPLGHYIENISGIPEFSVTGLHAGTKQCTILSKGVQRGTRLLKEKSEFT